MSKDKEEKEESPSQSQSSPSSPSPSEISAVSDGSFHISLPDEHKEEEDSLLSLLEEKQNYDDDETNNPPQHSVVVESDPISTDNNNVTKACHLILEGIHQHLYHLQQQQTQTQTQTQQPILLSPNTQKYPKKEPSIHESSTISHDDNNSNPTNPPPHPHYNYHYHNNETNSEDLVMQIQEWLQPVFALLLKQGPDGGPKDLNDVRQRNQNLKTDAMHLRHIIEHLLSTSTTFNTNRNHCCKDLNNDFQVTSSVKLDQEEKPNCSCYNPDSAETTSCSNNGKPSYIDTHPWSLQHIQNHKHNCSSSNNYNHDNKILRLEQENETLREQHCQMSTKLQHTQQDMQQFQTALNELQRIQCDMESSHVRDLNEARKEIKSKVDEVTELQSENALLERKFQAATLEIEHRKEQIMAHEHEFTQLEQAIQIQMQMQNEQKHETITTTTTDNHQKEETKVYLELESQMKTQQDRDSFQIYKHMTSLDRLRHIATLVQNLSHSKTEKEQLSMNLQKEQQINTQLQNQLKAKEKACLTLSEPSYYLMQKMETLERELHEARQVKNHLEQEIQFVKSQTKSNQEVVSECLALKEQMASMKNLIHDLKKMDDAGGWTETRNNRNNHGVTQYQESEKVKDCEEQHAQNVLPQEFKSPTKTHVPVVAMKMKHGPDSINIHTVHHHKRHVLSPKQSGDRRKS